MKKTIKPFINNILLYTFFNFVKAISINILSNFSLKKLYFFISLSTFKGE